MNNYLRVLLIVFLFGLFIYFSIIENVLYADWALYLLVAFIVLKIGIKKKVKKINKLKYFVSSFLFIVRAIDFLYPSCRPPVVMDYLKQCVFPIVLWRQRK